MFRVQRTRKKTGLELKWIVRCPFHRDDGDLPGTSCTRAAVFHNEEQKEKTRLMLQAWCLAGRFKKARAEPVQDSHKGVQTQILLPSPKRNTLLNWRRPFSMNRGSRILLFVVVQKKILGVPPRALLDFVLTD